MHSVDGGRPAGGGDDHGRRGAGSGVPQPRPRATPSGGAATNSYAIKKKDEVERVAKANR